MVDEDFISELRGSIADFEALDEATWDDVEYFFDAAIQRAQQDEDWAPRLLSRIRGALGLTDKTATQLVWLIGHWDEDDLQPVRDWAGSALKLRLRTLHRRFGQEFADGMRRAIRGDEEWDSVLVVPHSTRTDKPAVRIEIERLDRQMLRLTTSPVSYARLISALAAQWGEVAESLESEDLEEALLDLRSAAEALTTAIENFKEPSGE